MHMTQLTRLYHMIDNQISREWSSNCDRTRYSIFLSRESIVFAHYSLHITFGFFSENQLLLRMANCTIEFLIHTSYATDVIAQVRYLKCYRCLFLKVFHCIFRLQFFNWAQLFSCVGTQMCTVIRIRVSVPKDEGFHNGVMYSTTPLTRLYHVTTNPDIGQVRLGSLVRNYFLYVQFWIRLAAVIKRG